MNILQVTRDDERTRVGGTGDVLGWGVQFDTGACYIDWNRDAFPPGSRLDHPHVSIYGSIADVEQGTGGNVAVWECDWVKRPPVEK